MSGKATIKIIILMITLVSLSGCQNLVIPQSTPTLVSGEDGFTSLELATLNSLVKVSDYPLYTMHMEESRPIGQSAGREGSSLTWSASELNWGCSLFATLLGEQSSLFGRNFDWRFSPAVLLFYTPEKGYASVSLVDIAYLVEEDQVDGLVELPVGERASLLQAPDWPFDGMNEKGLAIGMAAVPDSNPPVNPANETIGSLAIMRQVLDNASTIDEAIDIFERFNIEWEGGPALHYLISDRNGQGALVEFVSGKMIITENTNPWHLATNHLLATAGEHSGCWRYDQLANHLDQVGGLLSPDQAMKLLSTVSQHGADIGTQWSIVYNQSNGVVEVVMGMEYDQVFSATSGGR